MEARIDGGGHQSCDLGAPVEMNGLGKRSAEWDLNEWRWDGDLFVATPLNAIPSDCRSKQLLPLAAIGDLSNSSSSCSGEADPRSNGKDKGKMGKRRREIVTLDEDEVEPNDEGNPLTLKLGGRVYSVSEQVDLANDDGMDGKRSKVQVGNSNRAVCQVEGCGFDLSDAKDYHRRHKVCETHAKASKALVGNVMQRFCQQCSRFHLLQEFDEVKRSCRRRLAGHNRRRRKTHPDAVANGANLTDDHGSSYLLISLLRIIANLNPNGSGQLKEQDIFAHLLKNIALLAGTFDLRNLHELLQASQGLQKNETAVATSSDAAPIRASNGVFAQESSVPVCSNAKTDFISDHQYCPTRPTNQSISHALTSIEMQKVNATEIAIGGSLQAGPCGRRTNPGPGEDCTSAREVFSSQNVLPIVSPVERVRFRSFDLNDICTDGHDSAVDKGLATPSSLQTVSVPCPPWLLKDSFQASPPQTSGNSNSASLTSSDGDAQSRTDRMVFKLFGKDPSDLPLVLRTQILDWLSSSPTDIEGYIKPGCIILTIYLRLTNSKWEQLCRDLRTSLERLLDVAADDFWRTGWVYARIQHQIAFIYDGWVVLDTPLPPSSHNCQILSVTPIAVSASEKVNFTVRGFNLAQSSVRLMCAFEGKYLVEEATDALIDDNATSSEYDVQCLRFSCSIPKSTGRGFIEVEDHGLGSTFYPFIVAEEDVSSEICMLETTINGLPSDTGYVDIATSTKQRDQALDFVHEMGWFLRRIHLRFSSGNQDFNVSIFPLTRFRWLLEFSVDNEWCAVVKKLLDALFSGAVELDGSPAQASLSDMAVLHNAVKKKKRRMVEFLLRYVPADDMKDSVSQNTLEKPRQAGFFFRPDMLGPFDLTPLHIAASIGDAEGVLDALTNDPGQAGIKAWKRARDSSGLTPEQYALSKGYNSYVSMVEKKNQELGAVHVVDIPGISVGLDVNQKQSGGQNSSRSDTFQIKKAARTTSQATCRLCTPRPRPYGVGNNVNLAYRPTMLFMVGIAAVCVCVGILLHSPPEVFSVFPPFRWELLDYGFM